MSATGDSEAKAREIVEAHFDGNPMDTGFRNAVSAITSALDDAVRGEREACAMICDDYASRAFGARYNRFAAEAAGVAAGNLATAIRSRSGEDNGCQATASQAESPGSASLPTGQSGDEGEGE